MLYRYQIKFESKEHMTFTTYILIYITNAFWRYPHNTSYNLFQQLSNVG